MKHVTLILGLCLILIGCQTKSTDKSNNAFQQVPVSSVSFQVEGMTCQGCEKAIEKAVQKLPGVKTVKASHAEKNTVVEFTENEISQSELAEAIKKTGYKVIEKKE